MWYQSGAILPHRDPDHPPLLGALTEPQNSFLPTPSVSLCQMPTIGSWVEIYLLSLKGKDQQKKKIHFHVGRAGQSSVIMMAPFQRPPQTSGFEGQTQVWGRKNREAFRTARTRSPSLFEMEPEIKHTDTCVFSSQDVELPLWFRSSFINYVLLLGQGRKENTQTHTLYLFDFTENVYVQLFYCKWGTCGIHIYRGETDDAVSPRMCPQRLWSLRYTKNRRFGDSVYIIHSWKILESSTSEFLQVWSTNHLPQNLLGCLLVCRPPKSSPRSSTKPDSLPVTCS